MLTDESYLIAWLVYGLATLCALTVLNFLTRRRVAVGTRYSILLLLAGLALAPAHPVESGATWAPAIFVAGFNVLTDGLEQAMPALRSIAAGLGLGGLVALLFYIGRRFTS